MEIAKVDHLHLTPLDSCYAPGAMGGERKGAVYPMPVHESNMLPSDCSSTSNLAFVSFSATQMPVLRQC